MTRRALPWLLAPALLLAALVLAWWLWKREVTFGPEGWRYRWHVAGTELARFPVVAPLAPPVFTQRITSGYGEFVGTRYATRAPRAEVLGAIRAACPEVRTVAGDAAACGAVLFSVTERDGVLVVEAFLSD